MHDSSAFPTEPMPHARSISYSVLIATNLQVVHLIMQETHSLSSKFCSAPLPPMSTSLAPCHIGVPSGTTRRCSWHGRLLPGTPDGEAPPSSDFIPIWNFLRMEGNCLTIFTMLSLSYPQNSIPCRLAVKTVQYAERKEHRRPTRTASFESSLENYFLNPLPRNKPQAT